MLQQTQVEQVIPYFNRFIKKFKTIKMLARASEQSVLKIWEGLGYYSRARYLHQSAQILVRSYNGIFPTDKDSLSRLPGFGPYTTNAVLSFAFNLPYAVVDGNIKRVIARLYMIGDDMRKIQSHKKIQAIMDRLLPQKESCQFNQAVMELGALICLPQNPRCPICPVSADCQANQKDMQDKLPFLAKKAKIPKVLAQTFIILNRDRFLVAKRPPGGMLAGLWEFPTVRLTDPENANMTPGQLLFRHFNLNASLIKVFKPITHTYTHFHLTLRAVLLTTQKPAIRRNDYQSQRWLPLAEIKKYPLHRAVWKVIEAAEETLIAITDRNIPDA